MNIIPRYLLIGAVIVVGTVAALLYTPLGERPLVALFAMGDVKRIDFAELRLTDKPNQFLMCPPGVCGADPHAGSPVFEVSIEHLRKIWREVLGAQPRVELLAEEDGRQFDYVQRSARFRFPDLITVRFMPVSSSKSTLAIYSRSVYGKGDFGVNRKRIEVWLKALREAV